VSHVLVNPSQNRQTNPVKVKLSNSRVTQQAQPLPYLIILTYICKII